jgi:hypothetical protein
MIALICLGLISLALIPNNDLKVNSDPIAKKPESNEPFEVNNSKNKDSFPNFKQSNTPHQNSSKDIGNNNFENPYEQETRQKPFKRILQNSLNNNKPTKKEYIENFKAKSDGRFDFKTPNDHSYSNFNKDLEIALDELARINKISKIKKYHSFNNKIDLDLSNQINLKNISPLQNFTFGRLNLSGTSVENISELRNVDYLNISNTEINLNDLKNININTLELGIVSNLTVISYLDISELKMMYFSGSDFSALKNNKRLRRIVISNGAPEMFQKTYVDISGYRLKNLIDFGDSRKGQFGGRFNGEGMKRVPYDEDFQRRPPLKPDQNFAP